MQADALRASTQNLLLSDMLARTFPYTSRLERGTYKGARCRMYRIQASFPLPFCRVSCTPRTSVWLRRRKPSAVFEVHDAFAIFARCAYVARISLLWIVAAEQADSTFLFRLALWEAVRVELFRDIAHGLRSVAKAHFFFVSHFNHWRPFPT